MKLRKLFAAASSLATLAFAVILSNSDAQPESQTAAVPSTEDGLTAFGGIQPRLSPNGSSIAFSWQGAICRVPRAGGRILRLTQQSGFDHEPAWSGDGRKIAYIASQNFRGGRLKLISAETGADVPLPKPVSVVGIGPYYKIEYHPTEPRILGTFRRDGRNLGLAWYNVETGDVATAAELSRGSVFALSRDGKKIAFTKTDDLPGKQSGNNGPAARLYLVEGSKDQPREVGRFPARIYDLCWGDGDRELVVSTDLGVVHNDLWRIPLGIDSEGRLTTRVDRAEKLTFGQGDEDRPSVARGRWLAFTDNRSGSTALTVRDLTTGTDRHVNVTVPSAVTGTLKIRTTGPGGNPLTARVSVQRVGGKFHAPAETLYRVLGNVMHFYCESEVVMRVPSGRYQVRAWRGPEFRPLFREVVVAPGQHAEVTLELERWYNAPAKGWHSGENHIHANYGYGEWYNSPATMLAQSGGEGLEVSNFMVANSDGDVVFDREYFRGGLDPLSTGTTLLYWNQEFRATLWGHMTLVNLQQVVEPVFTGFKGTTNPWDIPTNSDIADRTHWQNGLVNYTHVAQNPEDPYQNPYTGKAIPVDTALGKIDSLDLNNSYAGTVPLWYRLLNCGFRLSASAGTDCFLNRINSRTPGGDRVYVHFNGPLDYHKWIEGLRAGRSFVTNGPMLSLKVNGKGIGETIDLSGPGDVKVAAGARSQFPLEKLELIRNGKVIAEGRFVEGRLTGSLQTTVRMDTAGWLALRATGPSHPDAFNPAPQYAHTSPVYVTIGGKSAPSAEDAVYFLKWIDRLELFFKLRERVPNEQLRQHVEDQLEAARGVYSGMIGEAN